jgi:hypothetical protein
MHVSRVADFGGWWEETNFHETRDTGFLLALLDELWPRVPRYKPLSVGVVLLNWCPPVSISQTSLRPTMTDGRNCGHWSTGSTTVKATSPPNRWP